MSHWVKCYIISAEEFAGRKILVALMYLLFGVDPLAEELDRTDSAA
jgi:ABC-type sulfate transport system permease subunit